MSPDTRITSSDFLKVNEVKFEKADDNLLALWSDDFEKRCVLPIHHKPRFFSSMLEAKKTGKPLVAIAIACLDWQPAPDGEIPERDRVITPVFFNNKRAKRVAKEFAMWQRALNSFGIQSEIHFTFSDVEAIMTATLANMGQKLFNVNLERDIQISIDSIVNKAIALGVNIKPFRHLHTLMEVSKTTDLREIQKSLSGKENPSFHELLSKLYEFDLGVLPNLLGRVNPVVWLNLISREFQKDIEEVEELSELIATPISVVTPFANSGSWSTTPVGEKTILDKKEFISQKLGIGAALGKQSWLRTLFSLSDNGISEFLGELGIDLKVANATDKRRAVNVISLLTFGHEMLRETKVTVDGNINVIHFLSSHLGASRQAVRHLLKAGGVRLNGITFTDTGFVLNSSTKAIFEISRKILLFIN